MHICPSECFGLNECRQYSSILSSRYSSIDADRDVLCCCGHRFSSKECFSLSIYDQINNRYRFICIERGREREYKVKMWRCFHGGRDINTLSTNIEPSQSIHYGELI